MYRPPHFDENDPEMLTGIMQQHSFATVITHDGTAPFATHMPVLLHAEAGPHGTLVTHMARANPQWHHFADGREVLVIFHGPHAYVSPSWYEERPMVPTWNYAVVHAYGVPRLIEGRDELRVMLRELVDAFEAGQPQPYESLTDDFIDQLSPGIVGIEIPITRLEGKLKLSQNRSMRDRTNIASLLEGSSHQDEHELGAMMRGMI